MAKRDDIPKTDPSEIEALIQRLKQSKRVTEEQVRLLKSSALLKESNSVSQACTANQLLPILSSLIFSAERIRNENSPDVAVCDNFALNRRG